MALLLVNDSWTWPVDRHWPGGFKYFQGLCAIAYSWRGTHIPAKVFGAAEHLFGIVVADTLFSRVPGKPLKARWAAAVNVALKVANATAFVGPVFARVFAKDPTQT